MATLATLVVKLVGDIDGFSSSMDTAGRRVSKFGSDIGQVGRDMTTRVTAPIVGIGTAAVLMGNQFNAGMANVISLAPSAADEIAGLRDDVQDLAVDMGKSTGDMTGGLYQVVSAFGYSADSMDLLRINAEAASAGLATTTEAIDLTSAVTKAYGDTSTAAVQQVADLAMQTVALGQTTFPELAGSIGRVTPLAASLGVSMDELFGVMATGTGVTGSAAEVSTQFRGILQSLMAPTTDMAAAFKELGVSSGEELISIYGLEDGLANIMMIAEASGKPLQAFISSIEGQTLAMALAGPQADSWWQKTDAMRNSAGATALAFEAQTQGVNAAGFAMQQAAIQVQTMGQQIGQALMPVVLAVMPYIQQFTTFVQGLVQQFTALDPKTQMIILGVIGFAAALGPLLMILGPLVSGIGAVVGIVGALISPVGLVVVAVGLLAAAFATDFMGIRTAVTTFWEVYLKPIFDKLVLWLQTNIPVALQALAQFWTTTLLPAIQTVWAWIEANLLPLLRSLANLYIAGVKLALAALALIWETVVKPALQALWKFISEDLVPALQKFWEIIDGPVKTALGVFEGALAAVSGAIEGITGAISTVIGWINTLREKLTGLTLPDWLTPGSPTPLELGLLGIADAFGEASRAAAGFGRGMPNGSLALAGAGLDGGMVRAQTPAGGGQAGGQWNVTIHVNGGATNGETGRAVEMGVLRAARSLGLR